LATLAATCLFALMALIEGWRQRAKLAAVGPPTGPLPTWLTLGFVLVVGFLGGYGLLAVEGMRGLNAGIFPEVITPFTLRAFGSFYFALAIAAIPLLWLRGLGNLLTQGFASYGLIVFITAAALVFIQQFDFVARPTQAIYLGIYFLVGGVVGM